MSEKKILNNNTLEVTGEIAHGELRLGTHAVHDGYTGLWNTEASTTTTGQYLIISAGTDTYINGDNVYIRAGNNSTSNELKITTSGATIGGNTVWHAGNDGTGTGLDADTVDGIQASSFLRSDANDTASGTLTLSGSDWYLLSLGARGASAGAYGIGNRNDDNYRQLTFHVPNQSAYSSTGTLPSFGWYSNGAVQLMKLESDSGNLWLKGELDVDTIVVGSGVTLSESTDRADLLMIKSSTSSWGGLQVSNTSNEGIISLMINGDEGGLYDDQNGEWILKSTENGGLTLGYDNATKLTTTSTGVSVTGNIKVSGSLIHEFDSASGYIAFPKGAYYTTTTGSHTGAIKIKLPVHGRDDMLKFVVDIFDYDTGESVTMNIAGYLYQTTGNNEWVNCTVTTLTRRTDKDYTVRFGADGTNNCLWIGEINSTWSYPQVIVRDFYGGYTMDVDLYDDNWDITFVTEFDTVDETLSDNLPTADWDRIEGKPTIPSGNQIIDWTTDQGSTNIHSGNYTNTTYSAATTSAAGLMSTTDKTKLDGIEAGADVTDAIAISAAGAMLKSGAETSTAMKSFEANLSNQDDWVNSPVSILERGNIGTTSTDNKYSPNLNFHWRSRVSNSLWMNSSGILHYGSYGSTGVPAVDGTFKTGTLYAGAQDITATKVGNWNTAYTHSQAAHAPSNAEQNVQSDWNATSGDAFIQNKPTIPTLSSLGALSTSGGTMTGALNASGGLYFVGDTNMGFVPYPIGAQFRSDSSNHTGYIKIKLPTDITNSPDDMVSFHVDIYDYTTNEMISVFVGGYTYRTTSVATYWYNCTAIITAGKTDKNFTVRFGNDGTNYYVAIGETTSTWAHPSIIVRDVQCSYRSNVVHYVDGWDIDITTAELEGVDETRTDNFPVSDYNKMINAPSLLEIGTTATTAMAGNTSLFDGNYSSLSGIPSTFAPSSHNHNDLYYTESELQHSVARALGWVSGYGNASTGYVNYDFTEDAIILTGTGDDTTGAVYKAIRVKSGDKVRFTVMVKGSTTSSSGMYIRLYQVNGNLADGKTHVSNNAGSSEVVVVEDSSGDTNWYENGAVSDSWTNYEHTYTAPADGYVSLVVLNWAGHGQESLYIRQPDIQFEKVNDASKLGGTAASSYLTGIAANSVGITELNVSDGTDGQVLTTNGSGTLSFATVSSGGADTNYYLDGITRTDNTDTLVFSVNGATNQSYTFGSNAFTSYTDHSTQGYLTTETYTAHENTSDLTGTYGSVANGTKIDEITVDANGHITAITTGATGNMTGFFVEDGDGTEVQINNSNEWKFVEGGGIDINWTDTSAGSDSDPYDLTFTLDSDLRGDVVYIGSNTSNYIQFDTTNNRIDFYAGGAFVARMESDGDLHIKGDVIAFSNIFS